MHKDMHTPTCRDNEDLALAEVWGPAGPFGGAAEPPAKKTRVQEALRVSDDPALNPLVFPAPEFDADDGLSLDALVPPAGGAFDLGPLEDLGPLGLPDPETPDDELAPFEVPVPTAHVATLPLKGRLRACYKEWKAIGAAGMVLDWIAHGYRIPFKEGPPSEPWRCEGNHTGAREHSTWLRQTIDELAQMGSIQRWEGPSPPMVVSPLNVVPKATPGKFRLILDLRRLNTTVEVDKFHMDTLARLRYLFRPGDWLFSADLQSGYYHLEIHPDHFTYLGFEFEGQYYVFTCLPFGLKSAPWAFTMLTRQLVRHWRRQGIRVVHYLDDFLWLVSSHSLALSLSARVVSDLARLGLLVNQEKSHLTPTQHLKHLGFIIDTMRMVFAVPEDRRQRLLTVAADLLVRAREGRATARLIGRVAGHILSLYLALGAIARLRSRFLYRDVYRASLGEISWDSRVPLSEEARQDVVFWTEALASLPPSPIHPPPPCPRHVLYTDAGEHSWGANLYLDTGHFTITERDQQPTPLIARERFPPEHCETSSTFRELLGIIGAVRAFAPQLVGHQVLFRTDSQCAVRLWHRQGSQRMGRDGDLFLHRLVLELDGLIKQLGIVPTFQWIPRDANELADFWSKYEDPADWEINHSIFAWLDRVWGPHTVDRMASARNARLRRFYSRNTLRKERKALIVSRFRIGVTRITLSTRTSI